MYYQNFILRNEVILVGDDVTEGPPRSGVATIVNKGRNAKAAGREIEKVDLVIDYLFRLSKDGRIDFYL